MTTFTIDVPDEIVDLIGSPEEAATKVRETLVMDLLRAGELSQGRAAEILGVNRWDFMDLMVRFKIESGPATAEEMRQELDNARHLIRRTLVT